MAKQRRTSDGEKKARQRVERARAAYTKTENRVGDLRLRLSRAEQKLAGRAARLSAAEEALAALVAPAASEPAMPEQAADVVAAPAHTTENGAAPKAPSSSRRKATVTGES